MLCDPKIREAVSAKGGDPAQLLATYIDAINQVAAVRSGEMKIGLHLCRGNYKGHGIAEGRYEAVAERLFNEADVDTFFLEYDSARAGGFEPLHHLPKNKNVVLGLVSSKKSRAARSLAQVRRRSGAVCRSCPGWCQPAMRLCVERRRKPAHHRRRAQKARTGS